MAPAGRALGLILGELHDHGNPIRRITIAVVPTGGIAVAVPIETTKILGFGLVMGGVGVKLRGERDEKDLRWCERGLMVDEYNNR